MGKTSKLRIKATLENVEELKTSHPDFQFVLKLKCTACGEISNKWHDINESDKYPGKNEKSEHNYVAKCKMCSRESSIDIVPNSNGVYRHEDSGEFKVIVAFDCRGFEPTEASPGKGWIVKVKDSNKVFTNVDLSESEWVEYDNKIKLPVGIYEFELDFV